MNRPARGWRRAAELAALVALAGALSLLATPAARAQSDADASLAHSAAAILRDAAGAMDEGAYQRAADLARGITANPSVPKPDRAEAWRIYGLASFFLEAFDEAERAFLTYLKLDVEGRLDPALVPPEAIVFFEDVRARHAAELHAFRPAPQRRRYRALNLLVPAGQFQNGHTTKGWVLTGLGSAALIANLSSYAVLRRWCDDDTRVCSSGGESRTESARTLRTVNLVAGAVLFSTYLYGVIDGFARFRGTPEPAGESRASLRVVPGPGGGVVWFDLRF
ncbi:hypothetical protein [Haliangium ochraceum]|uniref:DUF5683 domain-containing protein n=1 Tax=Haliangium ochraceum (strain DSM 14365 / JCM 11303 / SMP-2) TaxID=502025 RepID=D0LZ38_HALO1|nr:hypothetical protein [Haliangium ochraceum]ACY14508.1 hypothetical protein Hoch_1962 [Haliangium ochraceum DSM 14365]